MKVSRILCLSVALALTPLALAKLQLPNDVFGRVEGSLDFCAQADPQSAAKYQKQKEVLVHEATEEEISEARASKEYKEAYDATTEEMQKQSKEQVKKACAAALENEN